MSEKRGRLRTRATLYFLLTALPAAMASAGAVVVLDRLIAQEIDARTEEIVRLTEQVMTDETKRVKRAVEGLTEEDEIQELAGRIEDKEEIERQEDLASALAAAADLDILAIVAATEPLTIVSSAHLPNAAGDPAPRFVGATPAVGVAHELVEGNPPVTAPALIAVVPIARPDGRPALFLYGGSRLDAQQLSNVARVAQATLVLSSPPLAPITFAAERSGTERPSTKIELLELPHAARGKTRIDVVVHTSRLETARTTFFTLSVVLVGASLLVALVSGTLLSNRITGPILELSAAAKEIGRGNLGVRIDPSSNDEVGALVEVFNDMTRELSESRERLARAERIAAWREIARRVAHEIKNPLFPIQMSMETLKKSWDKRHPQLGEIVAESTKTVLEEVRALNRIVTEFSEFARLPAPVREPSSVVELLAHVAGLYKDGGPGGTRVHFERERIEAKRLPSIAIDKEQLGRALINLVKNALEAMEAGGGSVRLDATGDRDGVEISVSDDGPGIALEIREKLFTPYFTTKKSGTGLGLAMVDRIVSEHDGRVVVSSDLGRGTTFRIWLPL